MAEEAQRKLVDEKVKIQLKRGDVFERYSYLQIYVGLNKVPSTNRQELHIRLTDEDNHFFLFLLNIGEDDFQNLKIQQGLLVDFNSFPQKFIELVEMCRKEEKSENPRFLLQFTLPSQSQSSGVLHVIETNPFKHLVHLSLTFLHAQDGDIKKYLADCLKKMKEENLKLNSRLSSTERDLSSRLTYAEEQLARRNKELEATKEECTNKINNMMTRHMSELSTANEKGIHIQESYEDRLTRERKETEIKYRRIIEDLEKKLSETKAGNEYLAKEKNSLEFRLGDVTRDLSSMSEEFSRIKSELQSTKRQNNIFDSDRYEKDKTLNHLRTRMAVLEQEVKSKDLMISKTTELVEAETEQKKILEEELKERRLQTVKLDATVKSVSNEVIKGNEIIHKLQNEIKSLRAQVKLKNKVTTKQESVIDEKVVELKQSIDRIEELKSQLSAKDAELAKLNENMEEISQKLNESKDQIKTNENVISWLNKQLNDQTLGSQRHSPGNSSGGYHPVQASTRLSAPRPSMLHSTPSGPFASSYTNFGQNIRPQKTGQVLYRPMVPRRTITTSGMSPLTNEYSPVTVSSDINVKLPLRQRQPPNQTIQEEAGPIIDPKYLRDGLSVINGNTENVPPIVERRGAISQMPPTRSQELITAKTAEPFPLTLKMTERGRNGPSDVEPVLLKS